MPLSPSVGFQFDVLALDENECQTTRQLNGPKTPDCQAILTKKSPFLVWTFGLLANGRCDRPPQAKNCIILCQTGDLIGASAITLSNNYVTGLMLPRALAASCSSVEHVAWPAGPGLMNGAIVLPIAQRRAHG